MKAYHMDLTMKEQIGIWRPLMTTIQVIYILFILLRRKANWDHPYMRYFDAILFPSR